MQRAVHCSESGSVVSSHRTCTRFCSVWFWWNLSGFTTEFPVKGSDFMVCAGEYVTEEMKEKVCLLLCLEWFISPNSVIPQLKSTRFYHILQQNKLAFSRDFCYIPLAKIWHLVCKIPRMVCASKGLAFGLKKHAQEVHAAGDAAPPAPPVHLLAARVKAAICIADLWVISGHNFVKKLVDIPNRMEEWISFLQHSGSFMEVQKVGAQQWYRYGWTKGKVSFIALSLFQTFSHSLWVLFKVLLWRFEWEASKISFAHSIFTAMLWKML